MIRQQEDVISKFLEKLIVSPMDSQVLDNLQTLFQLVLKTNKCLDGHPIPYHAITRYIYNYDKDIIIDDLNLLMDAVETKLNESESQAVTECFRKFKNHISLAATQKYYIQKIAADALEVATDVKKIAKEADAQAKSTIANYISILGIFASIIFTLFGGVNLIGSTVKLLEESSRLPYLIFIVALLMVCLLTLLNMMVKWVNSLSNLKNILENQKNAANQNPQPSYPWWKVWRGDFYTKAVSSFLLIAILSLVVVMCTKKEPFFSFTEEVTSEVKDSKGVVSVLDKPASEVESATEKPKGDVTSNTTDNDENNNKDVKVVKTFTFSNHPNSDKDEKEDE